MPPIARRRSLRAHAPPGSSARSTYRGGRVAPLDRRGDLGPGSDRVERRLRRLRFRGELIVLDRVAEPLRVIAAPQMEQPCVVVHALRQLQERREVERTQVEST